MKHTKEEILEARKTLGYGSSNKWKYVRAKDTLCSLADLYVGGTISEKTKTELVAADLLMALEQTNKIVSDLFKLRKDPDVNDRIDQDLLFCNKIMSNAIKKATA